MAGTRQTRAGRATTAHVPPIARALALSGLIGPIWFTAWVVLQGCLQPDYSHLRLPIGALAAWPTGWMQNLNFYVSGAFIIAFALALTTFAATGLGMVVLSRRLSADARWRDLAGYTRYSGIIVLVLFITVGFFAVDDGTPLHPWAGLIQRLLVTVWFAWMIVTTVRIRRA